MGLLDNKRCLVTGGSRGLGRAIACAFAREGAKVAFTYRRNAQDAADALTAITAASPTGASARSFVGSVSDSAHVREVTETLTRDWGGIDILVNNAGLTQIVPIALLDEPDWDEMMDTHVKGAYLYSRAVLKSMIRARAGQILNIGSFASERIIESPVHYAAAKSALRGFTEALAREVGRYGIRVNLLAPGLLDVGLGRMLLPHRIAEYVGQSSLGRTGTAAELAEFALFLCSDDSSFMSGAKVVVDGGV